MLNLFPKKRITQVHFGHSTQKTFYYLGVLSLTIATLFIVDYLTKLPQTTYQQRTKLFLAGLSTFFNVFVLYYHASRPYHPKFTMHRLRKWALYLHITAGCLELLACLLAYFTGNITWAQLAALVGLLGQIPTSYYQTPLVFGMKAVMIASYLFVITFHLFCATQLLLNPDSTYWLLNTFLILNTYVWVRVFYFLFNRIGLFQERIYTTSVLMAVMLVVPVVLGMAGPLLFWGYVAAIALLYRLVMAPDKRAHAHLLTEHSRDLKISRTAKQSWLGNQAPERSKAKFVFTQLDTNKNAYIDVADLKDYLLQWGLPDHEVAFYLRQYANSQLSFDEFVHQMEPIWKFAYSNLAVHSEE